MIEDEVIASQLEALLTPAITSQENYYRQLVQDGRNSPPGKKRSKIRSTDT
jgi:hypothetical protein